MPVLGLPRGDAASRAETRSQFLKTGRDTTHFGTAMRWAACEDVHYMVVADFVPGCEQVRHGFFRYGSLQMYM